MRRTVSLIFTTATLLVVIARPAAAQAPLEGGPHPATETPATTSTGSTTTFSGYGATHGTGLGVGVAAMLAGPAGISVAYDGGPWHLDTMFGVLKRDGDSPGNKADFELGARFWFHLHKSANSDFSVGGGLGFIHFGPADENAVFLEGGVQLRAFIASNVALSASAGLAIETADRSAFALGGQFIGSAALHYYFY